MASAQVTSVVGDSFAHVPAIGSSERWAQPWWCERKHDGPLREQRTL